jgi:hypothetical protein
MLAFYYGSVWTYFILFTLFEADRFRSPTDLASIPQIDLLAAPLSQLHQNLIDLFWNCCCRLAAHIEPRREAKGKSQDSAIGTWGQHSSGRHTPDGQWRSTSRQSAGWAREEEASRRASLEGIPALWCMCILCWSPGLPVHPVFLI